MIENILTTTNFLRWKLLPLFSRYDREKDRDKASFEAGMNCKHSLPWYYMPMIHTPLVITSLYFAKLHITINPNSSKWKKILEANMAQAAGRSTI